MTDNVEKIEELKVKNAEKVCQTIINALDALAVEVNKTHKDDLALFTDEVTQDYIKEYGVLDEKLAEVISLLIVMGVICEIAVQHRDNYFVVLNELLSPPVNPIENNPSDWQA